jgi:hypothetical protein
MPLSPEGRRATDRTTFEDLHQLKEAIMSLFRRSNDIEVSFSPEFARLHRSMAACQSVWEMPA